MLVAMVLCSVLVSVVLTDDAAGAVEGGDITTACAGTLSGSTFSLSADCDTTASLTVPNGITVDGDGHTITAHDPSAGFFTGPVVTNAGAAINLANLTVKGTGFAINCSTGIRGIFFNDASGSNRRRHGSRHHPAQRLHDGW